MQLPSNQQIEALHRKYALSDACFDLVFTHCKIVCEIAEQCITKKQLAIDADLVRVGCLLHDIGVYELLDKDGKEREDIPYITHGVRGEAILKKEGFPKTIWRFGSHHTGVGLTKQAIISGNLPLPAHDYLAETTEEALVMYADKFHSKDVPPCFNSFEWYRRHAAQFGKANAAKFEEMGQDFGLPDLTPLAEKYGQQVRVAE